MLHVSRAVICGSILAKRTNCLPSTWHQHLRLCGLLRRSTSLAPSLTSIPEDSHEPKTSFRRIASSRPHHNRRQSDLTTSWTFEDFERESSPGQSTSQRVLAVDKQENKNDTNLWLAFLRHRTRLYGNEGTLEIWKGMMKRQVAIPMEGDDAEELWASVVRAAFDTNNLRLIMEDATQLFMRTGKSHDMLYDLVIGKLFLKAPDIVWNWHQKFKELDLPQPGTFARIVQQSSWISTRSSLRTLERLYKDADDLCFYDVMITMLCKQERYLEAVYWHDILTSRGDYPSHAAITQPLRRHLHMGDASNTRLDTRTLTEASLELPSYKEKINSSSKTTLSRFFMNKVLGEKHGIRQKYISDTTCAKAFATGAFSVEFVVKSLSAFGVEAIGPLALRELAARVNDPIEVMKHIRMLQKLGMKVEDCVFSRLVLKLASEEKGDLLQSLLASDQHPEVLEDKELQKKLLAHHIKLEDWKTVHIALLTLTHGHENPTQQGYNVLLQARIETGELTQVHALVDDMIQHKITISVQSLRRAFFAWVPRRRPGHRPVTQEHKSRGLDNFITLLVRIMRQGVSVEPMHWRQPLIYLGMEGRLADLELLSLWLVLHYQKQWSRPNSAEKRREQRKLFDPGLQKAIVAWGFMSINKAVPHAIMSRTLGDPESLPSPAASFKVYIYGDLVGTTTNAGNIFSCISSGTFFPYRKAPWTRGVALLKVLRHCGLDIYTDSVRKMCMQRMTQLFGRDVSHRPTNRRAKLGNGTKFAQMLAHLNLVWDGEGKETASLLSTHRKVIGSARMRHHGPARIDEAQGRSIERASS